MKNSRPSVFRTSIRRSKRTPRNSASQAATPEASAGPEERAGGHDQRHERRRQQQLDRVAERHQKPIDTSASPGVSPVIVVAILGGEELDHGSADGMVSPFDPARTMRPATQEATTSIAVERQRDRRPEMQAGSAGVEGRS